MKRLITLCLLLLSLWGLITPQPAQASPAPEDARVYIISPRNGDTVPPTFPVKFGLVGMGIAPSGVDVDYTGHHHLLVDVETLPDLDQPLPTTPHVLHFGGGQTETILTLEPGQHQLQLILGNFLHIPHTPPVISEPITLTVES